MNREKCKDVLYFSFLLGAVLQRREHLQERKSQIISEGGVTEPENKVEDHLKSLSYKEI